MLEELPSVKRLKQRQAAKRKKKKKKVPTVRKKPRKYRKREFSINWGGAREGAGRPELDETYKITRTFRLNEEANQAYLAMKKFGIKPSRLVSEYLIGVAESLRLYDRED